MAQANTSHRNPSASLSAAFSGHLSTNRSWDILPVAKNENSHALRPALKKAARLLQKRGYQLYLSSILVSPKKLRKIVRLSRKQPLTRVIRETLERPIDPYDFLLFLDDLLASPVPLFKNNKLIWVSGYRARSAGIFLHPSDLWPNNKKPHRRQYGLAQNSSIRIDKPAPQPLHAPANDGDLLGPAWTARFKNPNNNSARMETLRYRAPLFAERLKSLLLQLRKQGATVHINSTLRKQERGYLMWGAFVLSRVKDEQELDKYITLLDTLNKEWALNIPIRWRHPDGFAATVTAATLMAETYDVVYATRKGAEESDHYTGMAIDFVAHNLPRYLTLYAPDKTRTTFDLSAPHQARDLSLSPTVIDWIETHFGFAKLRSDYPHWSDAQPLQEKHGLPQ